MLADWYRWCDSDVLCLFKQIYLRQFSKEKFKSSANAISMAPAKVGFIFKISGGDKFTVVTSAVPRINFVCYAQLTDATVCSLA
jgi:hypothetical protein